MVLHDDLELGVVTAPAHRPRVWSSVVAVAALAVAAGVYLAAHGGSGGPVDPTATLLGTAWRLAAFTPAGGASQAAIGSAGLRFDDSGGSAGSDGCHDFAARVTVDGSRLVPAGRVSAPCTAADAALRRQAATVSGVLSAPSTWRVTTSSLTLRNASGQLSYRVSRAEFPSDDAAARPTVLTEGRPGPAAFRLYTTVASGYLTVGFEGRSAPGRAWDERRQIRPLDWQPAPADPADCMADSVAGDVFVWGVVDRAATRVEVRIAGRPGAVQVPLFAVAGAEHFAVYGGFVGGLPSGSQVLAFRADGSAIGAPFIVAA